MGCVAALAAGLAALRSGSMAWGIGLWCCAVFLLGFSVLAVIFRAGPTRAWWLGYAVFGWGYVWLIVSDWPIAGMTALGARDLVVDLVYEKWGDRLADLPAPPVSPIRYIDAARKLVGRGDLTNATPYVSAAFDYRHLLDVVDRKRLLSEFDGLLSSEQKETLGNEGLGRVRPWLLGSRDEFRRVAYALLAIVIGLLGGVSASLLRKTESTRAARAQTFGQVSERLIASSRPLDFEG